MVEEKKFVVEDLPDPVPILHAATINTILFPGSQRTIRFKKLTPEDTAMFTKTPYCVFMPMYPRDTKEPEVAVLGHVSFKDEGDYSLLTFHGLKRVTYSLSHVQNGYTFVHWKELPELPFSVDAYGIEEYKKQLATIRIAFTNVINRLQEIDENRFALFYPLVFIQQAINRLYLTKGTDISDVIDGIMNVLCLFGLNEIQKHDIVRKSALIMLCHEDVSKRFNHLAGVIHLFYVGTFPDPPNGVGIVRALHDTLVPALPGKTAVPHVRELFQQTLMVPPSDTPRFSPVTIGSTPAALVPLDLEIKTEFEKKLSVFLDRYIVDQDRCKRQIIRLLIGLRTGLFTPNKPVVGGLFCGPTGVGKTLAPEVLAQYFFDDMKGYTRVDGPQFIEKHTISHFTGSPDGYLGHGQSTAFSQWNIDRPHVMKLIKEKYRDRPEEFVRVMSRIQVLEDVLHQRGVGEEKTKARQELYEFGWQPGKHPAIIVVDEMEKMHVDVLKLFIRILDDGRIQLMNGEETIFHNTIFFFTANIYGKDIVKIISQRGYIGFQSPTRSAQEISHEIWEGTIKEIEKTLPPEIFGRIGGKKNVVVFHPFREKDLTEIIRSISFPEFAARVREQNRIEIIFGDSLLKFILEEMMSDETSRSLGARALLTLLEHKIQARLGNLLLLGIEGHPGGLHEGDTIFIDVEKTADNSESIVVKKVQK